MKTIHAYTEPHNNYPAYINLSANPKHQIAITVRASGNAGRNVATIHLGLEEIQNLAADINGYLDGLLGDRIAPAQEPGLVELRRITELLQEQVALMKESRVEHREAMARYDAMTATYEASAKNVGKEELVTFDQFVQYGRDSGANIVGGMPWSFSFHGHPVSHENDRCYLIGHNAEQLRFTPNDLLVVGPGAKLTVEPKALPA